jgi:hypothetical protein
MLKKVLLISYWKKLTFEEFCSSSFYILCMDEVATEGSQGINFGDKYLKDKIVL